MINRYFFIFGSIQTQNLLSERMTSDISYIKYLIQSGHQSKRYVTNKLSCLYYKERNSLFNAFIMLLFLLEAFYHS